MLRSWNVVPTFTCVCVSGIQNWQQPVAGLCLSASWSAFRRRQLGQTPRRARKQTSIIQWTLDRRVATERVCRLKIVDKRLRRKAQGPLHSVDVRVEGKVTTDKTTRYHCVYFLCLRETFEGDIRVQKVTLRRMTNELYPLKLYKGDRLGGKIWRGCVFSCWSTRL